MVDNIEESLVKSKKNLGKSKSNFKKKGKVFNMADYKNQLGVLRCLISMMGYKCISENKSEISYINTICDYNKVYINKKERFFTITKVIGYQKYCSGRISISENTYTDFVFAEKNLKSATEGIVL